MAIETIPLSRLERDLEKTLVDELLASNPRFQALVASQKPAPQTVPAWKGKASRADPAGAYTSRAMSKDSPT